MIEKINFRKIQKQNPDSKKLDFKINFTQKKDEFIKSKGTDKYMQNARKFLCGVGIEELATKLIHKINWNDGSNVIGFNRYDGKIESVMIDVYVPDEGENKEIELSKEDFISMLDEVKEDDIKKQPSKKEIYEKLYNQLIEKMESEWCQEDIN